MSTQEVIPGFEVTYRLSRLELYNWGGFSGPQEVEFDPMGTAIVGPTGSGKTTLIDALMTLLTANPKYNLASTGGHESDRDLVSYVRGVSGAGNGSVSQEHVLRQGKVISGLCATLDNGTKTVKLGAVFSIDDTSFSAQDLKKYWIFSQSESVNDKASESDSLITLRQWLELYDQGGSKALTREGKINSSLTVYTAKKNYLARVRDYFEVGQNAFDLLNRAAGLKQLNSIDEIFRTLVLDDESQFSQAAEVANSFDDLKIIYEELELARRQIASLEPVKKYWHQYEQANSNRNDMRHLLAVLPVWFAEGMYKRWKKEADRLRNFSSECVAKKAGLDEIYQLKEAEKDELHARYLRSGGNDLQTVEEHIRLLERDLYACRGRADVYLKKVQALALDEDLTRVAFERNQARLDDIVATLDQDLTQAEHHHFTSGSELKGVEKQYVELKEEIQEAENAPGSNIPGQFLRFRSALAEGLGLPESELPFVAEMIQVKPDAAEWHGAIERAIGSHRLRIMVPESDMRSALRWVNQRNNQLHVRLYEVKAVSGGAAFYEDGFTRKLDYKAHTYRESVKELLAGIDRHCVSTAEDLQQTPYALTREGMISGKERFFEKQDQKRLSDDWMTGFDNTIRLRQLKQRSETLTAQLSELQAAERKKRSVKEECQRQLAFAQTLKDVTFDSINFELLETQIGSQKERLEHLISPDSDVAQIKAQYDRVKQECADIEQQRNTLISEQAKTDNQLSTVEAEVSRLFVLAEPGLRSDGREVIDRYFKTIAKVGNDLIATAELQHMKSLEEKTLLDVRKHQENLDRQVEDLSKQLVRAMEFAKREDRGALVEAGSDVEDVPAYLERLHTLTEEALPEKQKRFREYLNRSSDDSVTTLLEGLEGGVAKIRDKLEDVNYTLRRVDFQTGRYLQLIANDVVHESIRTFSRQMRELRAAQLAADDGESHYRALQVVVASLRNHYEKSHTAAAKALLDPRFRLEFKVNVISRSSGEILHTLSGSQGGSGGEKEIIASYVLTASLSYALCPDGSSKPLFGTIVLDEAFSRSSHAVAGRIISALTEFGLSALFVTPNKEMRLLRSHTRSAIVVHRKGDHSSLTTLTWKELEQAANQRRAEGERRDVIS